MITLTEVQTKVHAFSESNKDFICAPTAVTASLTGVYSIKKMRNADSTTEIVEGQIVMMSDHALGQICGRFTIPSDYFRRCPKALRAAQFNYWKTKYTAGHLLLRCRDKKIGEREFMLIRGVLSAKYSRLDNVFVADTLVKIDNTAPVQDFILNDKNMHIRFRWDSDAKSIQSPSGKKLRIVAGAHVANSEVGCRSMTVDGYLYLPDGHGMIVKQTGSRSHTDRLFYHQHRSFDEKEFRAQVATALTESHTMAGKMAQHIVDSMNAKLRMKGKDAIEFLGKKMKYSEAFLEEVVKLYFADKENTKTRFGVINAFSKAAARLGMERRLQVEQFAGELAQGSHWQVI